MSQPGLDPSDSTSLLSIEELLRPEAYPHMVSELTLRETHLSWIVLTGGLAYKIKKPVKLDFIDASTRERRRRYCEEELRLNRRLAPDLYLDVVTIRRRDGCAFIGGDGAVLDHAVCMRQFPAADELPALLARSDVDTVQIEALAELLAAFHLGAPVAAPDRTPARTEQMYETVLGNLEQLLSHLAPVEAPPRLGRLVDWTHESARALEGVFRLRERNGFVRECHGDLHASNIVRHQGRLVPFDCIEFDPRLRWIDVINDIAFLVMDLMSHERPDLAFALLSRYLEITGDYEGMQLLPFYAAYRALVRAKVDALTAEAVPARAAESLDRQRWRIRAAESWATPRQTVLVLMHGVSGSGKSWLSSRLVPRVPGIRIRSDIERKRIAGIDVAQSAAAPVRAGLYSPQFTRRTYSRLIDCTETCLRAGLSVIADAAFLEASDRHLFRALAARLRVPCVIVACEADPVTLARRIAERSGSKDPSDATLAVLDSQLRENAPFDPEELPCVIRIDTRDADAVRRVEQAIQARSAA